MLVLTLLVLLDGSAGERSLSVRAMNQQIQQLISANGREDAFWGVAIYAPLRGRYLIELNADRNFRTASNLKILTTLLAFETLGPEYEFETGFGISGRLEDDVVKGDLVVRAGGDPSMSGNYSAGAWESEDILRDIKDRLKAAGVNRIDGDLVAQVDFFDEERIRRSWEWDDMGAYYAVPTTPLSYHDSWVHLHLKADEQGQISIEYEPSGMAIDVDLSQAMSEVGDRTIRYDRVWGSDRLVFSGNLPPCSERTYRVGVWDPNVHFLENLAHFLKHNGIEISGATRVTRNVEKITPLFSIKSDPLYFLSETFMKASQNHYGNLFLKTIAREVTGEGSFDQGAALAREMMDDVTRTGSSGANIMDGSGLSVRNYLKPRQLVEMLLYGVNASWRNLWLDVFPSMGSEGTLASRGGSDLGSGRVLAKTGYIYRARNLSGYVWTRDGEPLIFSLLVNNYGAQTREINKTQDEICGLMTRLKINRKARKLLAAQ